MDNSDRNTDMKDSDENRVYIDTRKLQADDRIALPKAIYRNIPLQVGEDIDIFVDKKRKEIILKPFMKSEK